jgi:hypothetical protein
MTHTHLQGEHAPLPWCEACHRQVERTSEIEYETHGRHRILNVCGECDSDPDAVAIMRAIGA